MQDGVPPDSILSTVPIPNIPRLTFEENLYLLFFVFTLMATKPLRYYTEFLKIWLLKSHMSRNRSTSVVQLKNAKHSNV